MNNDKTCLWTHLTNETLDDNLRITIHGTAFKIFYPKPNVYTKGMNRIRGHSKPKRKGKNEDSNAKKSVDFIIVLTM